MPDMLLGLDFLRAHRMFVAHSQHRIYFTYVGGPVFQVTGPHLRRVAPQPDVAPEGKAGETTTTENPNKKAVEESPLETPSHR
ncbi:hypothetical protein [Nitrospirillum sp. BR 11163]|uniref:hypothetical protein n=1 Tax=Nitrospirillum sp. BR 11163 TaxID=3104323 RepID=UPI002AFDCBED|nr:hypothetical protein [Nitrospirillum sp. BR 11163]MEA1674201.1 hypothetical protein [Nitrospirillum sp. BR 11163]